MFSIIVKNVVKQGSREQYLAVMKENALASVSNERGCYVFDVLEAQEDDHVFYLYEIYSDEAALAEHKLTDHYLASRQQLAGLVVDQSVIRCDVVDRNSKLINA
ncbi:antibiotic biosynthesis monooxygenase [Vibrio sp. T187]|uniref:putative quinol monooxygenase n=1 Tax=Vibrio TaxID=662 RepID=UPI0010C93D15|nr:MULTISPECIES: putative quinol monooxygenase [Vibrio]MBW3695941.1 antibiotic biosynthesis monooxygenase [Vibrio sp. T187]